MAWSFLDILENRMGFKTAQETVKALKETEKETGMTLMEWAYTTEEGREHQRKANEYRFTSPDPFMPGKNG